MGDKLKSYSGAMVTSLPYLHERHVSGVDGVLVNVHAPVLLSTKAKTFIW